MWKGNRNEWYVVPLSRILCSNGGVGLRHANVDWGGA